jgi:hypothetical protein
MLLWAPLLGLLIAFVWILLVAPRCVRWLLSYCGFAGCASNHFRTRSSTRDCSSGVRIDAVSSRSFTARSMSEASSLPAIARLNQK